MVDSHFHLWRRAEAKQSGILASPYLQRDASWGDFIAAWGGLPVAQAVNIQVNDFCDGAVEAASVGEAAGRDSRLAGMIAWARLEARELPVELEALGRLPHVRGVRRTCQFEDDPAFCASPDYVRGVRLLGEHHLICEICVRHEQIRALPRLARAVAGTTLIVLEHMGKPDHSQPPSAVWLRAIEELAALPNVVAKLSPVVHSDRDPPYSPASVAPFALHLAECFGPDRILFGSNWPVSTAVVGYREWVDILIGLIGRDVRFWSDNARRVYGLPAAAGRAP